MTLHALIHRDTLLNIARFVTFALAVIQCRPTSPVKSMTFNKPDPVQFGAALVKLLQRGAASSRKR
jgi:hypothetical protein